MTQGKYERELKGILTGDKEKIKEALKTCNDNVKWNYETFEEYPFLVVRGAGSLGIDLIAVRRRLSLIVEVKSSKNDTIHLSNQKRLREQKKNLIETAVEKEIIPLYAYRLKGVRGEKWKLFTLNIKERLSTENKDMMDSIPHLSETRTSHKMEWQNGMKLSNFASLYRNFTGGE